MHAIHPVLVQGKWSEKVYQKSNQYFLIIFKISNAIETFRSLYGYSIRTKHDVVSLRPGITSVICDVIIYVNQYFSLVMTSETEIEISLQWALTSYASSKPNLGLSQNVSVATLCKFNVDIIYSLTYLFLYFSVNFHRVKFVRQTS